LIVTPEEKIIPVMAEGRFPEWPVLVTGAASGIGLACARRLATEGARVLLVGRRADALNTARNSLHGTGHDVLAVDAADEGALAPGVKAFANVVGALRGAIFCAGDHILRPLSMCKAENYEQQFHANVTTAAVAARVFVKFAARNGSSMVMLSSAAAMRGAAAATAYSAAKGALLSLSRSLAVELASQHVRVNALVAGVVKTAMSDKFLATLQPEHVEAIRKSHLLGFGEPDDVAAAACFLISSEARWITGVELVVDGGFTCH